MCKEAGITQEQRVMSTGRGPSFGGCACARSVFTMGCHSRPNLFSLKEKEKEGLTESINHLIDLGS